MEDFINNCSLQSNQSIINFIRNYYYTLSNGNFIKFSDFYYIVLQFSFEADKYKALLWIINNYKNYITIGNELYLNVEDIYCICKSLNTKSSLKFEEDYKLMKQLYEEYICKKIENITM